jgi:hypothetical protein
MTKAFVALLATTCALLTPEMSGPPAAQAETAAIDQVYFEARITRDASTVTEPHALVKVGADAELSVGPKAAGDPRFTLKYTVRPAVEDSALVIVTGLVDGRIVASGTLAVRRDRATAAALQGGGYRWNVTGEWMTPELVNRHKRR